MDVRAAAGASRSDITDNLATRDGAAHGVSRARFEVAVERLHAVAMLQHNVIPEPSTLIAVLDHLASFNSVYVRAGTSCNIQGIIDITRVRCAAVGRGVVATGTMWSRIAVIVVTEHGRDVLTSKVATVLRARGADGPKRTEVARAVGVAGIGSPDAVLQIAGLHPARLKSTSAKRIDNVSIGAFAAGNIADVACARVAIAVTTIGMPVCSDFLRRLNSSQAIVQRTHEKFG